MDDGGEADYCLFFGPSPMCYGLDLGRDKPTSIRIMQLENVRVGELGRQLTELISKHLASIPRSIGYLIKIRIVVWRC